MIEVEGLRKRFGDVRAVDDLSFRAAPGAVTGFLGPNGAGKSTTLRSILGLVHPDDGSARVLGRPVPRPRPADRTRVGAILEASEIHPGRSGAEPPARARPRRRRARLPRRRGATASSSSRAPRGGGPAATRSGMRQRLGLATALLGDPEVLIARRAGKRARPAGHPLAARLPPLARGRGPHRPLSSHVLAEVAQTVGRIVIINRGTARRAGHDRRGRGAGAGRDARPQPGRRAPARAARRARARPRWTAAEGALVVDLPPERVGEIAAANGRRAARAGRRAGLTRGRLPRSSPAARSRRRDRPRRCRVAEAAQRPLLLGLPRGRHRVRGDRHGWDRRLRRAPRTAPPSCSSPTWPGSRRCPH